MATCCASAQQAVAPKGTSIFGESPASAPSTSPARVPIPTPKAIDENRKLLHELFADDYRNPSPGGRAALAKKLTLQASLTSDDAASRYVLLDEARQIFVELQDVPAALDTVRQLAVGFDVDPFAMDLDIIQTVARRAVDSDTIQTLADAGLRFAGEAIAADKPDLAQQVLTSLDTCVRTARNPELLAAYEKESAELQHRIVAARKIAEARQKLAQRPSDPQLNAVVGRYECFENGNWEKGLPLLARGDDPALRELALEDLTSPEAPLVQFELAGKWWDWSTGQAEPVQRRGQERARMWYHRALPDLTGLKKALAQKRISSEPIEPRQKTAVVANRAVDQPTVIFFCDTSGSMIEKLPRVKGFLQQQLANLEPSQRFNIVCFADRDAKPREFRPLCVEATPENVRGACAFVDQLTAVGSTAPEPALKEVARQRPAAVELLSDGDFPDNNSLLAELNTLDRNRFTIDTVMFSNGRDKQADHGFQQVMQRIATDHGGTFQQVSLQGKP